jgi:hypothetical protein
MKKVMLGLLAMLMAGIASAKLPAPTEEAKATAALAKEKSAWGDKVAAYKLCLVQDKLAAQYLKEKGAKKSAVEVPACADPGPFVPSAPATAAAPAAPASAAASAPASTKAPAPAQAAAAPAKK